MKKTFFLLFFIYSIKVFSQNCIGNGCGVLSIDRAQDGTIIVKNKGNSTIHAAIRWYYAQCQNPNSYDFKPQSETPFKTFKVYCPPYTAVIKGLPDKMCKGTIKFINPQGSTGSVWLYALDNLAGQQLPIRDFCQVQGKVIKEQEVKPGTSFVYKYEFNCKEVHKLDYNAFKVRDCDGNQVKGSGQIDESKCTNGCNVVITY